MDSDKKPVEIAEEGAESSVEREARIHAQRMANLTGKGRPKGVPNKINKTIKEAVLEAVQPGACHEDGLKGWLIDRAQGGVEDRKIFAAVVSRVIPVEVTGADGGPVKIDLGWLSQRRIGYGDVVDVLPVTSETQAPAQIEQKADESMPYAGCAPDVISVTHKNEGEE